MDISIGFVSKKILRYSCVGGVVKFTKVKKILLKLSGKQKIIEPLISFPFLSFVKI